MKKRSKWVNAFLVNLVRDESGQDLIEYAIVAGLIGLGAIASMTSLSTKIRTAIGNIGNQLTNAT